MSKQGWLLKNLRDAGDEIQKWQPWKREAMGYEISSNSVTGRTATVASERTTVKGESVGVDSVAVKRQSGEKSRIP